VHNPSPGGPKMCLVLATYYPSLAKSPASRKPAHKNRNANSPSLLPPDASQPIVVASGTFGYAREMAARSTCTLAPSFPKTHTKTRAAILRHARPRRPVGMLNAIGLDTTASLTSVAASLPYSSRCQQQSRHTSPAKVEAGFSLDGRDELAANPDWPPGAEPSCRDVAASWNFATDRH